jgi:hypothetical protein
MCCAAERKYVVSYRKDHAINGEYRGEGYMYSYTYRQEKGPHTLRRQSDGRWKIMGNKFLAVTVQPLDDPTVLCEWLYLDRITFRQACGLRIAINGAPSSGIQQ